MGGPVPGVYEYRGETYRGLTAVSEASERPISTIAYHLENYGNLDLMKHGTEKTSVRRKPLSVLGQDFASVTGFAEAVGQPRHRIRQWMAAGDIGKLESALRGEVIEMRTKAPIKHGTHAAYHKRKCRCEVCRAANAEYMRKYKDPGYAGDMMDPRNHPITWRGRVTRVGTAAMAVYLGVDRSTVNKHMKRHGSVDRIERKEGRS